MRRIEQSVDPAVHINQYERQKLSLLADFDHVSSSFTMAIDWDCDGNPFITGHQ